MTSAWRGLLLAALLISACGDDEDDPSDEPDCTQMECYRPYVCVERCGGPVLSAGCCQCPEGQIDSFVDCPPEPTEEEATDEEAPAEPPAAPVDRPCSDDDDCLAVADCDCDCVPRLASIPMPEGEAWQTMCDGHPPPNCGAQSPCAEHTAACDADEGRCVVRPASP